MPLLTATSAFGLGRRRWSSPQQCYLHCLRTGSELNDSQLSRKRSVEKCSEGSKMRLMKEEVLSVIFMVQLPDNVTYPWTRGVGTAGAAGALAPAMLKPRGREYLIAPAIFSHIFACCSLYFHSSSLCCLHTIKTSHSVGSSPPYR